MFAVANRILLILEITTLNVLDRNIRYILRCSDELWRTNEHKSNESDHQTSYDQTSRYFLWVLDKTESGI